MSTPSREEMKQRLAEKEGLTLLADWMKASVETLDSVLALLPGAAEFQAGKVVLLKDALTLLRPDVVELADLKDRVARSMAMERLAAADPEEVDLTLEKYLTEPEQALRLVETVGEPQVSQLDPAELEAAEEDAKLFGTGFIVDGHRVAPQVVRVIVRQHNGDVTEAEL